MKCVCGHLTAIMNGNTVMGFVADTHNFPPIKGEFVNNRLVCSLCKVPK